MEVLLLEKGKVTPWPNFITYAGNSKESQADTTPFVYFFFIYIYNNFICVHLGKKKQMQIGCQ